MKRIGALTIAVAMVVAACGGSDETAPEPDVEVEAVDDDGALRLARGDVPRGEVQVINGCRIEPTTECPRANLSGANLRWAELWWADLSGANLSGANLLRADLRAADLPGANLRSADLRGAILVGVDLSRADLSRANLSGVDLRDANLSGARFCNTTMPGGYVRNDNC